MASSMMQNMIDPAEACKNVSQDVISLFHRYLTLDDVTGGRARSVVTPLGETFRPCCRVSTSEVCKKNNNLATLATKACWVGRVTIGAISRFAIALRLVQIPGFNATDTTGSEPPKSAVTVVAWKQPLGRAPVLLYILQGRSEARDALFFRFGFSRIRDTSYSYHAHLTTTSAAGQAHPRSLPTTSATRELNSPYQPTNL
jgi:hypothetical protein